ncbi:MAG: pyridoxal phosphate-dependent aminotransferase [Phycisphaera sp.]|nr:pyridoxal phosphate-dependent aminotransferase [Phycisphaera sp.]
MRDVQTPVIPVVGRMIAAHPGTISLGQGVVHYGPPPRVAERVNRVLADAGVDVDRYKLVHGIDELLPGLAAKLMTENGIETGPGAPSRIVVTAGSNMGFLNAVLAVADLGDEVIIQSPYYFNHEMAIAMAGCVAVPVPTDAEYQLDLAAIEAAITDRTRAVVTISPNNPTGAVYSADDLRAVNDLCRRRRIYHISDEAYEYFVYGDRPHFSAGAIDGAADHTISMYSFSKAYGMAGWRVGYMVIPQHLLDAVAKAQDTNLVCPPVLNQHAAAAALEAGRAWCVDRIAAFADVRDLVLGEWATLGDRVTLPQPDGAFYALMRVRTPQTDMQLIERLIADHGVAVMPGSTFGDAAPADHCSLRIAFGALARDTVAEGIGRLVRGIASLVDEA